MLLRTILVFIYMVILSVTMQGQLFLQMERTGTLKVKRYQIGDEVCFKLKGENQDFRTEYIEDILPEQDIIIFSNGMVRRTEIAFIRSFHPRKWSKPLGQQLMIFGVGWGLFSLGAKAAFLLGATSTVSPLTLGTAAIVGTAIGIGWIIQKAFRQKTYRFGKKRRLRILDLRVISIQNP